MPRLHRDRPARANGTVLAAAVAMSVAVLLRTHWQAHGAGRASEAAPIGRSHRTAMPAAQAAPAPASSQPTPRTAAPHFPSTPLHRLVGRYRPRSVSVAAYDLDTGRRITAGARRGMITASLVKVEFLETLLLRHQRSDTPLSSAEQAAAQAMIENSDNGAADSIYWDDDAGTGLIAAERPLGLSPARTKPRGDDFWGLSTTSANEQIALLKNLVLPTSPLSAASRRFALHLMENVEPDQCWGVPSVGDTGTTYAVKNGWLAIDDEDGLWAVSSDGVIQLDGDTVLMSVMTQHDTSMSDGVALVVQLAAAAAEALRQGRLR